MQLSTNVEIGRGKLPSHHQQVVKLQLAVALA